ncbi:MAG: hypothetical protein LBF37_01425, partial [Rickettsiales bacterium]|nr:hypothetical protein [Rickettsiales bacterium]
TEKNESGANKVYIQNIQYIGKPLCMPFDPKDDFWRLLRCQTNLMMGSCKCPVMGKVGAVLFPQYYVKCK